MKKTQKYKKIIEILDPVLNIYDLETVSLEHQQLKVKRL